MKKSYFGTVPHHKPVAWVSVLVLSAVAVPRLYPIVALARGDLYHPVWRQPMNARSFWSTVVSDLIRTGREVRVGVA